MRVALHVLEGVVALLLSGLCTFQRLQLTLATTVHGVCFLQTLTLPNNSDYSLDVYVSNGFCF